MLFEHGKAQAFEQGGQGVQHQELATKRAQVFGIEEDGREKNAEGQEHLHQMFDVAIEQVRGASRSRTRLR